MAESRFQLVDKRIGLNGSPSLPWGVHGGVDFPSALTNPLGGRSNVSIDHGVKYHGDSNDRCHMTYAVRLHTSDANASEDKDLYLATFLFAGYSAQGKAIEADFTHMRNIFMLNAHMRSEPGRRQYGTETDAYKICHRWRPLGFQITNTDATLMRQRTEAAVTVAVSHKARTPNVWLALGTRMEIGDCLYWLLRRHVVGLPPPHKPGASASTAPKTYWRWEPYISHNRRPPPRELYSSTKMDSGVLETEWVGTYLYVGQVTAFYGVQDAQRYQHHAAKAMFAEADNDYKRTLTLLPVVEVMYLVH